MSERIEVFTLNHINGAFVMADHWMHPNENKMTPAPSGEYVRLEDYTRLKSEVERLTEAFVDGKMREDRDSLLAEVERLTKAGDAMARVLRSFGFDEASNAWNAAKEVQS